MTDREMDEDQQGEGEQTMDLSTPMTAHPDLPESQQQEGEQAMDLSTPTTAHSDLPESQQQDGYDNELGHFSPSHAPAANLATDHAEEDMPPQQKKDAPDHDAAGDSMAGVEDGLPSGGQNMDMVAQQESRSRDHDAATESMEEVEEALSCRGQDMEDDPHSSTLNQALTDPQPCKHTPKVDHAATASSCRGTDSVEQRDDVRRSARQKTNPPAHKLEHDLPRKGGKSTSKHIRVSARNPIDFTARRFGNAIVQVIDLTAEHVSTFEFMLYFIF